MAKRSIDGTAGSSQVTFRPFRQESDYARMLAILLASAKADDDDWTPALDEIKAWCAPSTRFDLAKQLVFTLAPTKAEGGGLSTRSEHATLTA
jgi:hypothetical protein